MQTIEQHVRSDGFRDNASNLQNDSYYSASKALDSDTWLTVQAFFPNKTKEVPRQIRMTAERCPQSSFSEKEFRTRAVDEIKKLFSLLFDVPFPLLNLEEMKTRTITPSTSDLPGIKLLRTKLKSPYCDARAGGLEFSVDIFLN